MMAVEERIAAAVCWLFRQPGLPQALRYGVGERHGLTCEWCDLPLAQLLELAEIPDGDASARAFVRYPRHQQRELVARAQGAQL